jgi:hypothetical protein
MVLTKMRGQFYDRIPVADRWAERPAAKGLIWP